MMIQCQLEKKCLSRGKKGQGLPSMECFDTEAPGKKGSSCLVELHD